MPRLTGIELVKALADPPLVIFTTAYPQYALDGYELDVIDYLLKPVSFARFLKSVEKAQSYLKAKQNNLNSSDEFFFIKCNGKIEKILVSDVIYIEAMANYVIVHTQQKKFITYITFSSISKHLPDQHFMRIHKSYMVAMPAIKTIDGDEIITSIARLPLGKSFRDRVMKKIEPRLIKR
jgi:DNA-binding LytR/AlgR family response regulator